MVEIWQKIFCFQVAPERTPPRPTRTGVLNPETRGGEQRGCKGTLAILQKNAREELRIGLREFESHNLFEMRVYIDSETGEMILTKKDFSVKVKMRPELVQVLQMALAEAEKEGLLQEKEA